MRRRQFMSAGAALGASTIWGRARALESDVVLTVPAEDVLHERTFMQWPVAPTVYPDQAFLRLLQKTIANIANTISEFEPVALLASGEHHAKVHRQVSEAVEVWDIPTDDLWCRDSGPLFAWTLDGGRVISHLQFNGWGNKQIHESDGLIAARLAERLELPLISSGLTGEAGGIEHDGYGLLLAHESSWVNGNRNPGMSRDEIEKRLLKAYGAERMIWSPGVAGEDITDYHIDSLARFTGKDRVLINLPDSPDLSDPFHESALETYETLLAEGLNVEVIPEPEYRRVESDDFVASYANFYVCNNAVIAAQFGDTAADELAFDALSRHYPDREVVMLNVDALGEIGGGIHCATQQMPARL